ncbi:unnamed protein product [Acanthoscelides obtectus]|uniref:Uncharacterized protein n=1 Tax=Acanthoscelides obtectus TaxID=200917 RepID=A0A9P0PJY8_ACAOB|nr:unnamed protein product [Acanthoscelides obtectus]CAK1681930.1 hypothetical protein AOBTE_LOCUS33338 [Acanthoscelides obtectus]
MRKHIKNYSSDTDNDDVSTEPISSKLSSLENYEKVLPVQRHPVFHY